MAITATGLARAGNDSKGGGTLKTTSRSDETARRGHAMSTGGLSKTRLDRMHGVMAGHVERGAVPGLVALVSRRGEVHVDAIGMKAVGGSDTMRRDTLFCIASMTKPVTAAAAMILVEKCKLRLDEPVDRWLPELADRKVLKRIDSPLDDTVPAKRPITLRDLLTFRLGYGAVMVFLLGILTRGIAGIAPGELALDDTQWALEGVTNEYAAGGSALVRPAIRHIK